MYDIVETGKRIQKLRKEHGDTQEQLAEKLNITPNHLGKIETGKRGASIELLACIKAKYSVRTCTNRLKPFE